MQKLTSQGFFEDLAPYVNQSEAFDRSDFVDGIMDVYTFDNKLVGIPASFNLRTVVGSGAQQKIQGGLTLQELLELADRHPGALAFDGLTREEMMRYLMMFNEDTFIDWDTGACHFDSEIFQAVLEYVDAFPDSVGNGMEESSLPAKIRNGEVLFAIAELNEFRAFQEFAGMFGEPRSVSGFPLRMDREVISSLPGTRMGLPPYRSTRRVHGDLSRNFWRRRKATPIMAIFSLSAFRR